MSTFNIRKILVPIDFSDTSLIALEYAKQMARLYKASLTILHVFEGLTYSIDLPVTKAFLKGSPASKNILEEQLSALAFKIHSEAGVKADYILAGGKAHVQVNAIAKEKHFDIVIMGTHGASGVQEFFLGSNAYRVVSQANCPVITIQKQLDHVGFNNILVPIDSSFHSLGKVKYAIEIARQYNAKLLVLGMIRDDDDVHTLSIKMKQVSKYLNAAKISFETEIVSSDDFADTTLTHAKIGKADLIVIMNGQESDSLNIIISSYAQQIVNHSKIPVLSVKSAIGHVPFPTLVGMGF